MKTDHEKLKEAVELITHSVCLPDLIYHVRERNDGDWDAPKVKMFVKACNLITELEKSGYLKSR